MQVRVATALQVRDAAALQARSVIMLQLASRQCCGVVVARVAGALRRCCSTRRYSTVATGVATTLRRYCSSQQRWKVAHYAMMASGSSACDNGRQGYTALQRWQVANVEFFYFYFYFLLDSFKERTRARQREKRQGFPALLVGKLLPVNSLLQRQLPLAAAATLAPSDSNNTLVPSGSNNISSTSNTRSSNDNFKKNSRTYKQKKSVAFNMKHRKCSFFRIEMYYKEVVKAYVNGGRVVTTVSI